MRERVGSSGGTIYGGTEINLHILFRQNRLLVIWIVLCRMLCYCHAFIFLLDKVDHLNFLYNIQVLYVTT